MAAYTKAWIVPWDENTLGIAYQRDDGVEGCVRLIRGGFSDLPALLRLLSPADLEKAEKELNNVVPFPRSRTRAG